MERTTAGTAIGLLLFGLSIALPVRAELLGSVPGSSDSTLVTIDPSTGAATVIGAIGFPQVLGLATAPSGNTVFGGVGAASTNPGEILSIDPVTGAGTAVGMPGAAAQMIGALAFSAGGTLYASCANFNFTNPDTLCTIDQSSGQATAIGPFDSSAHGIWVDGLAFDGTGTLFAATRATSANGAALYTVSTATGQATLIGQVCTASPCGATQLSAGVTGLAFLNGTLYGSTSDGHIITLDPTTAVYAAVGAIGVSGSVQDLTVLNLPPTPVPPTDTPTNTPTATATPPPCSVPGAANACVPGGGIKSTDCYMEWLFTAVPLLRNGTPTPNVTRAGIPRNRFICYEGDPRCDIDTDLSNGSCTMPLSLCINNTDPRLPGCTPTNVFRLAVRAPNPLRAPTGADMLNLQTLEQAANAAPPAGFGVNVMEGTAVTRTGTVNSTPNACSGPLDIVVPLRKLASGRVLTGRKTLRTTVTTTANVKDTDTLHLQCRPSTCGDGIIQTNHETCDDGNRVNGDGCNQACQVEPGFACSGQPSHCVALTPTSTATSALPTDTPTATATSTATSALPSATPTDTATPTATGTPTETGTPTQTGTPTATPTVTPTLGPPLGSRTFALTSSSSFFSSFLPTSSVGTPRGSLVLVAGGEDGNGHATVTVAGPSFITTVLSAGGVTLCTEIESCTGDLYCNGGANVDATETLDSLKTGLTCTQNGTNNCPNLATSVCCSNACEGVGVGSGNPTVGAIGVHVTDSGAGALALTCMQRSVSVNATSGVNCTTQDYSMAADTPSIYTSGSNTAIVTNHCAGTLSSNNASTVPTFAKTGQAFSCSNWTTSNAAGRLAFSIPTEQPTSLFAGDGAQAGVFAGN